MIVQPSKLGVLRDICGSPFVAFHGDDSLHYPWEGTTSPIIAKGDLKQGSHSWGCGWSRENDTTKLLSTLVSVARSQWLPTHDWFGVSRGDHLHLCPPIMRMIILDRLVWDTIYVCHEVNIIWKNDGRIIQFQEFETHVSQ